MSTKPLKYKRRVVHLQKCITNPDFGARTILVEDQWDYVEMWLRRKGLDESLVFWRQAEEFYKASCNLPYTSSPLTNYYCALNATKALLIAKNIEHSEYHGLSGERKGRKTSLASEVIHTTKGGVFSALSTYLGETSGEGQEFILKDILYNLPYIHRAYTVTFGSQPELFIPVSYPIFVQVDNSSECYLKFEVKDSTYQHQAIIGAFKNYERDIGIKESFVVRRKKRFNWNHKDSDRDNLQRLNTYHAKVRRSMYYIKGIVRLWYLKKEGSIQHRIERSSLTLTFMALHRLSELARYNPDVLMKHLESRHNWLLSEFIARGLEQYLDELAAEMTGHDFMPPSYSTR
jgi:hypothetical protein